MLLANLATFNVLTLLHSELPKLHRVLATLSAIGSNCFVQNQTDLSFSKVSVGILTVIFYFYIHAFFGKLSVEMDNFIY